MKTDEPMRNEFEDDGWICPDIKSFEINNDPWNYIRGSGSNLVMVINNCKTAVAQDIEAGLSSYTNAECEEDSIVDDSIEKLGITSKIMSKDQHNPERYF